MKEATSELNSTVVVVLAIGVLIAFFYYTLWPIIKGNFDENAKCSEAICETVDGDGDGFVECHSKGKAETFECIYKG